MSAFPRRQRIFTTVNKLSLSVGGANQSLESPVRKTNINYLQILIHSV